MRTVRRTQSDGHRQTDTVRWAQSDGHRQMGIDAMQPPCPWDIARTFLGHPVVQIYRGHAAPGRSLGLSVPRISLGLHIILATYMSEGLLIYF